MRTQLVMLAGIAALAGGVAAQPAPPPSAPDDTTAAIARMRDDMVDAFNKGDLERLLSHATAEATVTWQNAEVSHGPAEIRAYYTKMMSGPEPIVKSVTAHPVVEGRRAYGDWAVSWGHMGDHFILTDGRDLALDSRFTAVLTKSDGQWKVDALHLSANAFGGAVVETAIATTARWVGLAAGGGGLLVGIAAGVILGRRRRGPQP